MIRHYFSTLSCGVAEAGRHRLKQIKLQGQSTTTRTPTTTTIAATKQKTTLKTLTSLSLPLPTSLWIERRLWVTLETTQRRRQHQRRQQQQHLCMYIVYKRSKRARRGWHKIHIRRKSEGKSRREGDSEREQVRERAMKYVRFYFLLLRELCALICLCVFVHWNREREWEWEGVHFMQFAVGKVN